MDVELWETVDRYLRNNDSHGAAGHLESLILAADSDRFSSVADSRFTNPPQQVLEHINTFITACRSEFDVRAVYLEMNGFDINYDCWYFDLFAYCEYGDDPDDLEWLCDWQSPDWEPLTLTGLEQTQDDFRWYSDIEGGGNESQERSQELAALLVMVRFVELVAATLEASSSVAPVPVLATAHDYEMLGRFEP
jgi:hypothetical protein